LRRSARQQALQKGGHDNGVDESLQFGRKLLRVHHLQNEAQAPTSIWYRARTRLRRILDRAWVALVGVSFVFLSVL